MIIHLLVGAFVKGDGISNAVFSQFRILNELGYKCDIYALYSEGDFRDISNPIVSLKAAKDDLIIDHIGGYSFYAYLVDKQPCKKVLYYHNITPPEFVHSSMEKLCRKGLKQLSQISGMYDFICGVSAFNLECLKKLGEQREGVVLPIPVIFPLKTPERTFDGGKLRFLFVGRYVENKRIEDLIRVFDYYHSNVNSNSELSVVGNPSVSPSYTSLLQDLVESSSSAGSISLVESVSDAELRDYYNDSDVYLCMSEHEGFCIPIVEAMYNKLIVFAFDSSAVGDTMGGAGVLLQTKDPKQVAATIGSVLNDTKLVNDIREKEFRRASCFSKDNVKKVLSEMIVEWSSDNNEIDLKRNYKKPGISFRLLMVMITPQFLHPLLRRIKRTLFH